MTNVWYRDSSEDNIDELHLTDPPQYVDVEKLLHDTGIKYTQIPKEVFTDEAKLKELQEKGGYIFSDWLTIDREHIPDYEKRLKIFYTEHLHEDDEIRLFTEGGGFFEVRDKENRWIRIHAKSGVLLNLPAGSYHRFTLDKGKYVKMLRLFTETPQWAAINRPEGDQTQARRNYLSQFTEVH